MNGRQGVEAGRESKWVVEHSQVVDFCTLRCCSRFDERPTNVEQDGIINYTIAIHMHTGAVASPVACHPNGMDGSVGGDAARRGRSVGRLTGKSQVTSLTISPCGGAVDE